MSLPSPSAMLATLQKWVEFETPTEAPDAINQFLELLIAEYAGLPVTCERVPGTKGYGDHLIMRSTWGQDKPGILVLSHSDTVHPIGFLHRLPFKIDGDIAYGPGIYDMKGGLYIAVAAFRAMITAGQQGELGFTHLIVSDEEVGSPSSRAVIEREGRRAKYVLVTEPARDGGKIVVARKGVGRFDVNIKGVPAHAGTRPQDGRSAIHELGHVIQTLAAMNDPALGISVNVGVVRGGSRPNVVAEEAYAEVDLRVPTVALAEKYYDKIMNLKPVTPDVSLTISGEINRPPFEQSAAGKALFEHTKLVAKDIGIELEGVFTGGGSDGNFTAPYAATLDGLGIDGKGAHTHYEQMIISSLQPRTMLLQRLYETLK